MATNPTPPTLAQVAEWHHALLGDRGKLLYLYDRALPLSIIEDFQVGWDGTRYVIPIPDFAGALVNVRRYKPNATSAKMLNWKGLGHPTRLFPAKAVEHPDDWVVIGGGEWDILSARAEGMDAYAGTNGEGAVPAEGELAVLRNLRVAIVLDSDKAGRAAAKKWSGALTDIAEEVRIVRLPREGMDLNDLMVEGGGAASVLTLIDAAAPAVSVVTTERRSADGLLAWGRNRVSIVGSRNRAGFDLACQMRDERYSIEEAWALALAPFQAEFEIVGGKDDPYTESDARVSLEQAFASPAREAVGPVQRRAAYQQTELGNAERFIAAHGANVRYIPAFSKWYVWDDRRWVEDELGLVMVWMKLVARSIAKEAFELEEDEQKKLLKWARSSESAARLEASLKLARSEGDTAMRPDQFDTNRLLLNVANGTLDLATRTLQPHRRDNYLRRMIGVDYDSNARAPEFEKFLKRVQPDPKVRAFLQRAVGYSLTGETGEHKLLLLHGLGANGKSTLVELLHALLGAYAQFLPAEALAARSNDRIPNDIARLDGARFVSVMEFEDSAAINERLVKQMTGGDTMSARFMRGEFFDFRPQFTLWVSSNHRPVIKGSDDGIWRRFLLVDFPVQIPKAEIDTSLGERLRTNELPGVLAWAVEGAAAWLREGLNPPASVLSATAAYRSDSDLLGAFLDERCEVDHAASVAKGLLYDDYKAWCLEGRLHPATKISFGRMLRERADLAITEDKVGKNKVDVWLGIDLREVGVYGVSGGNVSPIRGGSISVEAPANDPPIRNATRRRQP